MEKSRQGNRKVDVFMM